MIHGTIALHHWGQRKWLESHPYKGLIERKRIIESWKKKYEEDFNFCFIQISPAYVKKKDKKVFAL